MRRVLVCGLLLASSIVYPNHSVPPTIFYLSGDQCVGEQMELAAPWVLSAWGQRSAWDEAERGDSVHVLLIHDEDMKPGDVKATPYYPDLKYGVDVRRFIMRHNKEYPWSGMRKTLDDGTEVWYEKWRPERGGIQLMLQNHYVAPRHLRTTLDQCPGISSVVTSLNYVIIDLDGVAFRGSHEGETAFIEFPANLHHITLQNGTFLHPEAEVTNGN